MCSNAKNGHVKNLKNFLHGGSRVECKSFYTFSFSYEGFPLVWTFNYSISLEEFLRTITAEEFVCNLNHFVKWWNINYPQTKKSFKGNVWSILVSSAPLVPLHEMKRTNCLSNISLLNNNLNAFSICNKINP